MIGQTLGSYRVTGELSRGGMGAVYTAEHVYMGRKAAVKVLLPQFCQSPELRQRFYTEAKATAAITHPGIVDILDFGADAHGNAFLVMEFLDGEPLNKRLRRGQSMTPIHILALVEQMADALAAAHEKGIVHRDLKPGNIMVLPDPVAPFSERVKVLDFGIAKVVHDGEGDFHTRTGMMLGTPSYMAPEQCRGAGRVDHRADLYALGCIFFHMLCGRPPFVGEGAGEIMGMQQFFPPPNPRSLVADIEPAIDELVMRLLHKDPEQRTASAAGLRAELHGLRASMSASRDSMAPGSTNVLSHAGHGQAADPHAAPTHVTPSPTTPMPASATPAPHTPAPHTPAPVTPMPVTPAPHMAAPVTPAPITGNGVVPTISTLGAASAERVGAAPAGPAPLSDAEPGRGRPMKRTWAWALAGGGLAIGMAVWFGIGTMNRPGHSVEVVAVDQAAPAVAASASGQKGADPYDGVDQDGAGQGDNANRDSESTQEMAQAGTPAAASGLMVTDNGDLADNGDVDPGNGSTGDGVMDDDDSTGDSDLTADSADPGSADPGAANLGAAAMAAEAETAAIVDMVAVNITSEPPGALVRRGDEKLGVTPLALSLERADEAMTLTLTREGYRRAEMTLVPESDHDKHVTLKSVAKRRKPKAAAGRPRGKKDKAKASEAPTPVDTLNPF